MRRAEDYVVSDGTYSIVVDAETPEDAALLGAKEKHSVYGLRHGVQLDVFPLREAYQFKVQYARPNSEDGPHERLRDYGEAVIVRQFQKVTTLTVASNQDTKPKET